MAIRTRQDLIDVLTRTMDNGWLDPILADPDARAALYAIADVLARISVDGQEGVDNTTISNSAAGRGGTSTVTLVREASGTSGTIPQGYAFVDARGILAFALSDTTVASGVLTVDVNVATLRKTELVDTVDDPVFTIAPNLAVTDSGLTNALVGQDPAPSGFPAIVTTTFTAVSSSMPIENGASDWLATVGHERGQLRQSQETDGAFRLRVRNVPDAVSPVAISQGIQGAATHVGLPAPIFQDPLNDGASVQARADAQVDWFDSVFLSGEIDVDGNVTGTSPAVDFCDDIQPDLVNLKPREIVSLREANAYFRVTIPGEVDDPDHGRIFFDDAFFDDPLLGYPDIHDNSILLSSLMSIWEEANRKRAAGVRFDEYLDPTKRLSGVGDTTSGTDTLVWTLLPPPTRAWWFVDGHFGWDAPTDPTFASAFLRFTFLDGSTYNTPRDETRWSERMRGVDVYGDAITERIITRVEGYLASDGIVLTNLVGNIIVIEGPDPMSAAPPLTGLVFEVEGDVGLTDDGAGHFLRWQNQALLGGNPDLVAPVTGPNTGVDSLDGVPGVDYPTASEPYFLIQLDSVGGKMKDRTGANFGFGVGERQPRTTISICRPRNSSAFFNITGGTLMRFGNTTGGGDQDFECLFNVEPLVGTDGWFLFSNNWRNGYNTADTLLGPDQVGGNGGTWDGVPVAVMHWFDGVTLKVFVNDFATPIISSTMPAPDAAHPNHDRFVYGAVDQVADLNGQWHGGRFADYIYDWGIDVPTIRALVVYLTAKFPSIAIIPP